MKTLWFMVVLLISSSIFAESVRIDELEINYQPIVSYNYLQITGPDLAKVQPEIQVEYIPNNNKQEGSILRGKAKITLLLYIYVDVTDLVSSTQLSIAKEIAHYQVEDAKILLQNKFGGFLTRLEGKEFESADGLLITILDKWNENWEPSVEMWKPYYDGLRTGIYPKQRNNYIASYRRHHFGNTKV